MFETVALVLLSGCPSTITSDSIDIPQPKTKGKKKKKNPKTKQETKTKKTVQICNFP